MLKKSLAQCTATVKKLKGELAAVEDKLATLEATIDEAEASIFASFCKRIKVANIREYEETQLKQALEDDASTLKFTTVVSKLNHQCVLTLLLERSSAY